jgi:hypothetical protein
MFFGFLKILQFIFPSVSPPQFLMDPDLSVSVAFTDASRLTYALSSSSQVFDLISQIRSDPRAPIDTSRPIQLLFLGRLLAPEQCLGTLSPSPEFTVNCFTRSAAAPPPGPAAPDLQGFDRLARAGYTPEQIADLRAVFHRLRGLQDGDRAAQLAQEEEWVPAVTVMESPMAAIRYMQVISRHGDDRFLQDVRPVEPIRGEEWDHPLLQQQDGNATMPTGSWRHFGIGVALGLLIGKRAVFLVPAIACTCHVFGIGMLFGLFLAMLFE